MWSGAAYERLAEVFAPIHERVVDELAPRTGERLLDLACGTGGVALLAARRGAEVTGLDISPDQLAKARERAAADGLSVRFDRGDCRALPYDDASFDVVASTFGVVFAGDHQRAAGELARVCRRAGRIAVTAWPADEWSQLGARLGREYSPGDDARDWARPAFVRALLGEAFALRLERGDWVVRAESADALWEFLRDSVPPLKHWLDSLDAARRREVDRAYLDFLAAGELRREYTLVLGRKR
jgi:SAM-dependent methyltransferase